MTIRMFLASRFRKLMLFGVLAWFAFAGAGIAASSRLVPQWLPFVPFVGFAAVVLLVLLWIRCPRCGSPVGQNVGALNGKDRFYRKRVNFCAHCGVSFDEACAAGSRMDSRDGS